MFSRLNKMSLYFYLLVNKKQREGSTSFLEADKLSGLDEK